MRTIFAIALFAFTTFAMTSANAEVIDGCKVTDYGHNVYYLQCDEVGPALATLRDRYPDSVLIFTFYEHVVAGSTIMHGYYVIVNSVH